MIISCACGCWCGSVPLTSPSFLSCPSCPWASPLSFGVVSFVPVCRGGSAWGASISWATGALKLVGTGVLVIVAAEAVADFTVVNIPPILKGRTVPNLSSSSACSRAWDLHLSHGTSGRTHHHGIGGQLASTNRLNNSLPAGKYVLHECHNREHQRDDDEKAK